MRTFFEELKKRRVVRAALGYGVIVWIAVQVAATVLPVFHAPAWIVPTFITLVALGFPVVLVLAWAFDLRAGGIELTPDSRGTPASVSRQQIGLLLVAGLALASLVAGGSWIWHSRSQTPSSRLAENKEEDSGAAASRPDSLRAIPEKSIAVLPFENLSDDKQNSYFTDGVQDEILTTLAKIADLKVISRTSVMHYKDTPNRNLPAIAQELKVAHILEGSVQRASNRVRVTAQLIDARTDTHVWAERYDRDLADVFAIQSEIAQAIARQLQAKLSPKEKTAMEERPTSDLPAHDLYVRAKEMLDNVAIELIRGKEQNLAAIQLLDDAIARDSTFLLAHCLLAYAHDSLYFYNYDHTETRRALAEQSVKTALRLKPDAGEAHLAQAVHFYWGYLDYERARKELMEAQRTLPNNAQVYFFLGCIDRREGRWDESARNLEHALELDPRNLLTMSNLMSTYASLRRYEEASQIVDRALAINPRSAYFRVKRGQIEFDASAKTEPLRAIFTAIKGEGPSAANEIAPEFLALAVRSRDLAAATSALGNISPDGYSDDNGFPFPRAWCEAIVAQLRGDAGAAQTALTVARAEIAKKVLAQPENAKPLSVLGRIDAALGRKEDALREGRRACELLPITKDALDGPQVQLDLARIYALTGEKNLALEQLETLARVPAGPSYGQLELDPSWDSLRDDPRFEKITRPLAPKKL